MKSIKCEKCNKQFAIVDDFEGIIICKDCNSLESSNKDIYSMKLHDLIDIGFFGILRVCGGWIYFDKGNNQIVFVPNFRE